MTELQKYLIEHPGAELKVSTDGFERLWYVDLWEDYGYWLVERVGLKEVKARKFSKLLADLHNIPFRYSIALDENRAADGFDLRDEYSLSIGVPEIRFDRDCSVLEMLVGLAIRIDCEYIGDPGDEHPEHIFWEMIENLFDFERYYRNCSDERYERNFVISRVEKWLDRTFDPSGHGSIFPLKRPLMDQRKIEIWSQMNGYLSEKYPI